MTSTSGIEPRMHNLDYLRGLAALGIMVYHYMTWSVGTFGADGFLGRIGVYGVSIFYVLSGLTLYHVYHAKMESPERVRTFFVRRVFRIFPLLWLVTIAAVIIDREIPNLLDLFLNLSGLFGFVKWDAYFSPGVWSIGNELVFYALFPLIVLAARTRRWLLAVTGAALLAPYLYFSMAALSPAQPLADQWSVYINPLNQAFLFFGGFLIGYLLREARVPQFLAWSTLGLTATLFVLWPVEGDQIALVTGTNLIVFTMLCFAICASAYKISVSLPRALHLPLGTLGEASYSLYLIHPLVFSGVSFLVADRLPVGFQIGIAAAISLAASAICYRYFEQFFMRLGRAATAPRPLTS